MDKKNIRPRLNIQLFAGEPGGNPPGGEGGTGGAGEIEAPEYITNYVAGIEDPGQREYLEGLVKDEKGLGTLKTLIKDPNAEWQLDATAYKEKLADTDKFIETLKAEGYSEEYAKSAIENRISYLDTERNAMSAELRAADTVVNNFIATETDPEKKGVLERLGENAKGREILLDYMKLKSGPATPGIKPGAGEAAAAYTKDTFRETFQAANKKNDTTKLNELKAFAKAQKESGESYFADYLMI